MSSWNEGPYDGEGNEHPSRLVWTICVDCEKPMALVAPQESEEYAMMQRQMREGTFLPRCFVCLYNYGLAELEEFLGDVWDG